MQSKNNSAAIALALLAGLFSVASAMAQTPVDPTKVNALVNQLKTASTGEAVANREKAAGKVDQSIIIERAPVTKSASASTPGVTPSVAAKTTESAQSASSKGFIRPGTLASAKTVKELIEMDDQLALLKEKAAYNTELRAQTEKNPVAIAAQSQVKAVPVSTTAAAAKVTKPARKLTVRSIMGVGGERIVSAAIDGKPTKFREGVGSENQGFRLLGITGQCASFENVAAQATPSKTSQLSKAAPAKGKTNSQPDAQDADGKVVVACFALEPVMTASNSPNSLSPVPGMPPMPVPIPLPMPNRAAR